MGAAVGAALEGTSYVEHEYVASGIASSYRPNGSLSSDGRWSFEPDTTAPYRTRVLVRRPATAAAFSGTVVIEWLNVSGGLDANPEYTNLEEELIRQGDAWVGVSAQLLGIVGGPILVPVPGAESVIGKGLKAIDPARYGALEHPGDGYSFDIFTQVGAAIRKGGKAMGELIPQRILAAGQSQSAIALTTYINGVQPLTHEFDGFFVHSRAFVALPLVGPGKYADLAGGFGAGSTIIRDDTDVAVLDLQSESDVIGVLNSLAVRQPDTDHFRLWEVTGTAHADAHTLGPIGPTLDCGAPINNGPIHLVAKAALHALDSWVRNGTPPAIAPRIEVTSGATPAIVRDPDGIAVGGIRTPPVDVPTEVLSGVPGSNPSLICLLLGSTQPLPATRLSQLYPSRAAYQQRYDEATDNTIKSGFVLESDRAALRGFANPTRVAG